MYSTKKEVVFAVIYHPDMWGSIHLIKLCNLFVCQRLDCHYMAERNGCL